MKRRIKRKTIDDTMFHLHQRLLHNGLFDGRYSLMILDSRLAELSRWSGRLDHLIGNGLDYWRKKDYKP